MSDERDIARTLGVAEARRQFSRILDDVYRDGERFVIEKHGIPVAAIVPPGHVEGELSSPRHERLQRALGDLDDALRALPRSERRAAIEQAIEQVRYDYDDPEGPAAFFEEMLGRQDMRELLVRLAHR